ncbi:hypothetical protein AgCh_023795 [Apium graveolens]
MTRASGLTPVVKKLDPGGSVKANVQFYSKLLQHKTAIKTFHKEEVHGKYVSLSVCGLIAVIIVVSITLTWQVGGSPMGAHSADVVVVRWQSKEGIKQKFCEILHNLGIEPMTSHITKCGPHSADVEGVPPCGPVSTDVTGGGSRYVGPTLLTLQRGPHSADLAGGGSPTGLTLLTW